MLFMGGDLGAAALAGGLKGDIFKGRTHDLEGGAQGQGIANQGDGVKVQSEIELKRTADVITVFSGATAEFAQSVLSFKNSADAIKRAAVNFAMGGGGGGTRLPNDASNGNANVILGHDGSSPAPAGGIPIGF
jgi:hypothetical protein